MHVNPELVGVAAGVAFIVTILSLSWAIRKSPRAEVPDWIQEEISTPHWVRLRCIRCERVAGVIMPTRCEGAMIIREIFAGQHRLCVEKPVLFV